MPKLTRHLILSLITIVSLSACKTPSLEALEPAQSQTLNKNTTSKLALINGNIYTVNSDLPWAEAIVVENNKIIFVGTDDEATALIDDSTQVIDLKGKMAMPGIHDTHLHPLEAGSQRVTCILGNNDSLNLLKSKISDCVNNQNNDSWLLGWGHSLTTLLDSQQSPRAILDEIESQKPIAIMEATSHSVWVNSAALALAKIDATTPQPIGGIIVKNEQGNPNGILLDAAGDLIFDLAYTPTPELLESHYEGLLYGLSQVAKNGITSIVDARVYWKRGYLDVWKKALQQEKLTARTVLSLWAYPNMNDDQQLAQLKSMYSYSPDSLLNINQIKFYSDGILHNTTAALIHPYDSHLKEVPAYGINYFSADKLARYTQELAQAGFDMHIHAIGDRGVKESLDAIEFSQKTSPLGRHKITHVEMVDEQDKLRFNALNVTADFQVAGEFTHPENAHWMEPLIGNRAYQMLPLGELYESGANITLSSDWDVSSLSPFIGMQNALNRGVQSLPDLATAIKAYTINGAYVMRQEQKTGSLEVGKFADIIILDQNLFSIPTTQIGQTKVLTTILDGKIIFQQ
ncbi:amidohydrolase [Aliikangiella sp. IMCC44653]